MTLTAVIDCFSVSLTTARGLLLRHNCVMNGLVTWLEPMCRRAESVQVRDGTADTRLVANRPLATDIFKYEGESHDEK